jgi:hypothetical protein
MFRATKSSHGSLLAHLERARQSGYAYGDREAKVMLLAHAGFDQRQAVGWLNTKMQEGRANLIAQRATEREIEAWDLSCRIMFMVRISASKTWRK